MTTWDPAHYLRFDDERARPFHDLLARVSVAAPRRVVDLGCGPGHLTELLVRRWPDAVVEALDSSPEMVAKARANGVDAILGDVAAWNPAPDTDVVICNAVLHWVPGHPDLLGRWLAALPAGAELAVQVPGNFGAPSHALVRVVLDAHGLRERVGIDDPAPVLDPTGYGDVVLAAGAVPEVWETTYGHRLQGPDAVLEWISGTALLPVRAALDDAEWAEFRADLAARLREAYPQRPDGSTWFPFRRIFVVAHKP